jgi:hypothetical protein
VTRKRRSASGSRKRSTAGKKYKRYDPLTGLKVMMTKDDPRYDEWPSRKPSKKTLRENRIEEGLENVGVTSRLSEGTKKALASGAAAAAPSIVRRVPRIAKALKNVALPVARTGLGAGTTVALGAPGTLALLAAAGIGSYFGTRWIIDNFPTRQRRLNAAADAYRQSRRELAQRLGRELTAGEQQELAAHYKSVVAGINKSPF